MSDKKNPRRKEEALVTCLSCGQTSKTFVLLREDGLGLEDRAKCPKCSNIAHTNSLLGLFSFMRAAAKEIVALKMDMLDVQGDSEER